MSNNGKRYDQEFKVAKPAVNNYIFRPKSVFYCPFQHIKTILDFANTAFLDMFCPSRFEVPLLFIPFFAVSTLFRSLFYLKC